MLDSYLDEVLKSIDPVGCIVNCEGIILSVSAGWKKAADQNGLRLRNYAIGENYLRHCIRDTTSLDTYRGLSKVLSGKTLFFGSVYPCHEPERAQKWFFMAAFPSAAGDHHIVILHLDISYAFNSGLLAGRDSIEFRDDLLMVVRRAVREEIIHAVTPPAARIANNPDRKRLAKLTDRQLKLLQLLANGYSNAQIAQQRGIALSSVKSQMTALLHALDCENRTQAALLGAKLGLDGESSQPDNVP